MHELTPEQVARFQRDGFLNAGPILTEDEVTDLSDALDAIIAKGPKGFEEGEPQPVLFRNLRGSKDYESDADGTAVWQILNMWEATPAFERLIYHPLIVKATVQLTGFMGLQVWHDQVQYKPANVGGCTAWHQDAPLWPSIEPMTPVSAWIPFDDAEVDNGCMWMVPGSHKWGNQMDYLREQSHLDAVETIGTIGADGGFTVPADSPIGEIKAVAAPVKRGEVHFHHSLTWHGSPQNVSPRPRRALAIHYMTSDAVFTGRNHPMRPFIEIVEGEKMIAAGPHFPIVARDGQPTGVPSELRSQRAAV